MSRKASTIGFLAQLQQSEESAQGGVAGPRVLTGEMAQKFVEEMAKAQVRAQRKALLYTLAFLGLVGAAAWFVHNGSFTWAVVAGLLSLDALIQSHKG